MTRWHKFALVAAMAPLTVHAGWPGQPPCNCGNRPVVPVAPVTVQPLPVIIPQPVCAPQVQTRLRTETYTVNQPVTRTQLQQEAYVEEVPVTTYRQVTTDEGSYQQVWVPKIVTKSVPETTVQKQVRYRTVQKQVTENIPQTVTRLVPEQVAVAPAVVTPIVPRPTVTIPTAPVPVIAGTPCFPTPGFAPTTMPLPTAPVAPRNVLVPVPTTPSPPTGSDGTANNWQKVPQKSAESGTGNVELQSYEYRTENSPRRRFSPAPSAAAVWQAQRSFQE